MPVWWAFRAPRDQAAGRDLCRGAARSAALRGGRARRPPRLTMRTGRPEAVRGRGRPRPHPVRPASKPTVPARLRSFIIPNERWWLPYGFRLDPSVGQHSRRASIAAMLIRRRPPLCSCWRPAARRDCSSRRHTYRRLASRTVVAGTRYGARAPPIWLSLSRLRQNHLEPRRTVQSALRRDEAAESSAHRVQPRGPGLANKVAGMPSGGVTQGILYGRNQQVLDLLTTRVP
jgi:hypothetical protein